MPGPLLVLVEAAARRLKGGRVGVASRMLIAGGLMAAPALLRSRGEVGLVRSAVVADRDWEWKESLPLRGERKREVSNWTRAMDGIYMMGGNKIDDDRDRLGDR